MALTAAEREVVLNWNDEDRAWHVYCDSLAWRSRLLAIARKHGAEVAENAHGGIEFTLPRGVTDLSLFAEAPARTAS